MKPYVVDLRCDQGHDLQVGIQVFRKLDLKPDITDVKISGFNFTKFNDSAA